MKMAILFNLSLILMGSASFANIEPTATTEPQKIEIGSAECHSSFGNMFCSGDYTCRQAALENAQAKNCKLNIKKIESQRHDDFISSEVSYRSYSCTVEADTDCSVSANTSDTDTK